ncbi:hypothetical protein [Winogradskyella sp. UBA3174]|uniref:hypothetical protein n=1 Tax=Winogradskyella sp. UBA3174 TaxID=1947785 RepID=UPI0025D0C098|nr:hypothetical protein [Winogradskyella sp. UBA3174]
MNCKNSLGLCGWQNSNINIEINQNVTVANNKPNSYIILLNGFAKHCETVPTD